MTNERLLHAIPNEAEFECPNGHKFTAHVFEDSVTCSQCLADWIEANIPKGVRISERKQAEVDIANLGDNTTPH